VLLRLFQRGDSAGRQVSHVPLVGHGRAALLARGHDVRHHSPPIAALTKKVNERCTKLEEQVLNLIEDEQLPPSFRGKLGSSIYTRGEIWASPLEGNHARLTEVLRGLGTGWEHLLPTNVNSQTLSGIVRGAYNEDTDSFDLPPDLLTVLKITKKTRVVSNG
jgi:hypothetical protein